ncbi:chemotaxis protein CheW, partial [Pseudomonas aeruginosa]|nr:chemotaxis protein CheW [Pseudomonas aeruginosa]
MSAATATRSQLALQSYLDALLQDCLLYTSDAADEAR